MTTWIAADWGTTHLRVWAMSASGTVLGQAQSDQGMGSLTRDGFEPALTALIAPFDAKTVIACGMVGSRQGWIEAPYLTTPCPPLSANMVIAPTTTGLTVHVIPGIRQNVPADVMRGEETQISGFLALNPGWDGVICLPGTHSKWVHVSAGEVVSFQTFMTGELFSVIGSHTVLRHSLTGAGWDDAAFIDALGDIISHPEKLAARLFAIRAEGLLHDQPATVARARLSGLLIGAELAAARPYWLGQQIAVVGAGRLAGLYVNALATLGASAIQADNERVTLAGLQAAYRLLKGQI